MFCHAFLSPMARTAIQSLDLLVAWSLILLVCLGVVMVVALFMIIIFMLLLAHCRVGGPFISWLTGMLLLTRRL